jgi:transcription termination factor NusB
VWDKPTRLSIFSAIYEVLFWREQNFENNKIENEDLKDPNWGFIFENLKFEVYPEEKKLDILMGLFYTHESLYTKTLSQYLINWDKTYSIVKACLFSFMLELETNKEIDFTQNTEERNRELITKYIRLSEDHIGGQNVGLVHAVLSKILSASTA